MRKTASRSSRQPVPRESAPPISTPDGWTSWWFWALVLAPVLVNAYWLWPELASVPSKNDSQLHLLMIRAASDALREGHNPLDFWIPQLELGYPQFLYYQHLPHLAVVALHRALFGTVSLESLFHAVQFTLLVVFPITVAWSMRTMGFSAAATATAAVAASLLSGNGRYGFDYNSYLWRGVGLYTQLWSMHLSWLTLAAIVATVNERRAYIRAGLLLAMLVLSHLVYAYMMAITSVVVVLVGTAWRWSSGERHDALLPRAARLAVIGGIAALLSSYMLWPFLQSSHDYVSSLPGLPVTGRSRAAGFASAVTGSLLDFGRWPVLTWLTGVGIVAALVRRGRVRVLTLSCFAVWIVLYLGRLSLGGLDNLLPSHSGFVRFRFIGATELFAILLIGLAGEALFDALANVRRVPARARAALATAGLLVILLPAAVERSNYYAGNRSLIAETGAALNADEELQTVLASLTTDSSGATMWEYRGRVYAGPRRGWGAQMMIGPSLRVFDLVNTRQPPAIGNPLQGLALNSGLLYSFREGDSALYDAFDVRTVVTTASATVPPFFRSVRKTNRYEIWHVPTTGVARYVAVTARKPAKSQRDLYVGASEWFVSSAVGTREVTRWDYGAPPTENTPFAPRPACSDGGRTLQERVTSQRVSLTVECPNASALVLKMNYHPNWRVAVDGAPATVYIASPGFIGFDLPAGQHVVEAEYVGTPSKWPLVALGVLSLLVAIRFRRQLDYPAQWLARPRQPAPAVS